MKSATVIPKNNNDNCFQYALTVALNYQNIEKDPQRISKIKPFINQYERNKFSITKRRLSKKFESNNKSIALNILFAPFNTKEIRLAYKSKHNFKGQNQVILLMITDVRKWHYLVLKSMLA